jgi:hypothetical protein
VPRDGDRGVPAAVYPATIRRLAQPASSASAMSGAPEVAGTGLGPITGPRDTHVISIRWQ